MFLSIAVKSVNLIRRVNPYEGFYVKDILTELVYPMIFIAIRNKLSLTR